MEKDTSIGGAGHRFPDTRHSAVLRARDQDPEVRARALELLLAIYWKPVYKHLRLGWKATNEEAKDWTQGFFTRFLEKELLERYDPARGSFRHYLRLTADSFVANERKAAGRQKRGGDLRFVSLDFESAEGELKQHPPSTEQSPEDLFEREWARSIFQLALIELERVLAEEGKTVHFRIFERYDLAPGEAEHRPSYQELARECALPVTQITNYLAATRRRFRRIVLDRLRDVTGSESEFRAEARRLLGGSAADGTP